MGRSIGVVRAACITTCERTLYGRVKIDLGQFESGFGGSAIEACTAWDTDLKSGWGR